MTLQSLDNQYAGINAQLNSYLQNESGGWASFHATHINDIGTSIEKYLPSGYFIRDEKSLQIDEISLRDISRSSIRPDTTIYQTKDYTQSELSQGTPTSPTDVLALPDTFAEENELTGILIYQTDDANTLGRPITRIELLSPTNKQGGSHHLSYMTKRRQTLESGLRLVEIDYLHEYAPLIHRLPDYSKKEKNAYPYTILINDPRPDFDKGSSKVFAWQVDDPLPVIDIPLAGTDTVAINFTEAYNLTFKSRRFYSMAVDYEIDPINFEAYTHDDQTKIKNLLNNIRIKLRE